MNPAASETVPLLHNMSVPPRTPIAHRKEGGRDYGRGIVVRVPDDFEGGDARRLLAWIDGLPRPTRALLATSPPEIERQLRERLDERAAALDLPAALVVTDQERPGDRVETDRLTIAAVLAKSSERVYLRDKVPNLGAIRPGRRVVLVVPPRRTG